jgi:hypothetical protein
MSNLIITKRIMWTVDSKSQITNLNYTSLNAQDLSK